MSTLAKISRVLHAAHYQVSMPSAGMRFQAAHHKIFVDISAKPTLLERSGYSVWGAASLLQSRPMWRQIDNFVASEKLLPCDASWMRIFGGQTVSALCLGVKLGAVLGAIAYSAIAVPLTLLATRVYACLASRALFSLEAQLDFLVEQNMHAQQLLNVKLFDLYREELFALHKQGRISPLTLSAFCRLESAPISDDPKILQDAISVSGFWGYLSPDETQAIRIREAAIGAMVFHWNNEVGQVLLGQAAKCAPSSHGIKQETARVLVSRFRRRAQAQPTSLRSVEQTRRPLLAGWEGSSMQQRLSPFLDSSMFDSRFAVALDLDTQAILKRGEAELQRRLEQDAH